MARSARPLLAVAAMVALAGAVGCRSQAVDLTPQDVERTGPGGAEIAVAHASGVRIEAASDAWPGSVLVPNRATPLKVSVDNHSGRRLAVRYEEFALVGPDGTRWAALPPFEADPLPEAVSPLHDTHLSYHGFYPAPHLATYYPFLTAFRSPLHFDPLYWDHYYLGGWRGLEPAVGEARLWAIPEGVLDAGGALEGFLYFEKLPRPPEGPAEVTFRADLVDPDTGERFGTAEVGFRVDAEE